MHICTARIKEKCPWFFHLKAIINNCPSHVPAGTGNNSSRYDVSLLIPTGTSEFDSTSAGFGVDLNNDDDNEVMDDGGDEGSQGSSEGSTDKESTIDDSNDDKVVIKGVMKHKAGVLEPEKGKKMAAWKGKSVHMTSDLRSGYPNCKKLKPD